MIKFKIDTKEIFHVISIEETNLTANMAEDLMELVAKKQEEENKSITCSPVSQTVSILTITMHNFSSLFLKPNCCDQPTRFVKLYLGSLFCLSYYTRVGQTFFSK